MSSTKRWGPRLAAYGLLGLLLYAAAALGLFALSLTLLRLEILPKNRLIEDVQRNIYNSGYRHVWQWQPECVEYDPVLLYRPSGNPCHFKNPEFKTSLHFNAQGRVSGPKPKGRGIAMLGDSYTMGWGVEDSETFSALLERELKRPVYNLGVSSYGTFRELQRLELSGLVSKVDTVVIQYCDNDLEENTQKLLNPALPSPEGLAALQAAGRQPTSLTLKVWTKLALYRPLAVAARSVIPDRRFRDFGPHYEALLKVLERFPWLQSKRVLIFYTNDRGWKFSNYAEVTAPSKGGAWRFVDLDLGADAYFRLDDHLTKEGHRQAAEKIAAWLADFARP